MDKNTQKTARAQFPDLYSKDAVKRLAEINLCRESIESVFTQDDLDLVEIKVLSSHGRGSGGGSPLTLDIDSITALVEKVSACLHPKWIEVRCCHGNTTFIQIRCRNCEGCRHAWRHKVRSIIMDGCSFASVYFLTLTVKEYPGKLKSLGGKFDVCQERWHDLLRSAGKDAFKFEYVRVVELQKRGTPHFHLACRGFVHRGRLLSTTEEIYEHIVRLARSSGFGFRKGKTIHFEAARLGGAGVASYLSKYLQKSQNYYDLKREDGRAIRRYSRSRGWSKPSGPPAFRYSRCNDRLFTDYQSEKAVSCYCGEGMLLNYNLQVKKWLLASRREKQWVAPLGLVDHIFKKEKESKKCHSE